MRRIEFKLGDIHSYRYEGDGPYALLICHGAGGWGGMYDTFCHPYAEMTRADIWCWDAPGFGQSGAKRGQFTFAETHEGLQSLIAEIRRCHDKPIFVLGSSLGGLIGSTAFYEDEVRGVIIQASPIAVGTPGYEMTKKLLNNPTMEAFLGTPFGKSATISFDEIVDWENNYGDAKTGREVMAHPLHTDRVRLASMASLYSWEAPHPLSENNKPFLQMYAGRDPIFPPGACQALYENVGGPKEQVVFDSNHHQLMLFHTEEFCDKLASWCSRNLP